jgi:hypothetical protein
MNNVISVYERCLNVFGIRLRLVRERRAIFDGRAVYMGKDFDSERFLSDLAHEVGHCLAAAPERRKAREWGLGKSYEGHYGPLLVGSMYTASEEELRASLLGICLQKHVEGRLAALWTWRFHDWPDVPLKDAVIVMGELVAEGLIEIRGLRPKILEEI